ncbi:MAG: GntR family transcriptional regulator [Candidatus Binatia bacterium]
MIARIDGAPVLTTPARRLKPRQAKREWPVKIASIDRPKSLTDHAYERLKAAIRDGSLNHQQFYPLGDLASIFGISRTPVREAVLKLAHEGLVTMLPQRGFRLREISPQEATEVFELRSLIEGRAVEKLAKHATAQEIQDLRAILRRQQHAMNDVGTFLDIDEEFHLRMLELAGLRRAREFLVTLRDIIWSLGSTALHLPGRLNEVLVEHTKLVDGIEKKDPVRARRALDAHLHSTFHKIKAARAEQFPQTAAKA